jgi:hypothetical protein
MKYRVDVYDLASLVIVVCAFIFIGFFFAGCCYPDQPPTVVWELHMESIHGVPTPSPVPFVVDVE